MKRIALGMTIGLMAVLLTIAGTGFGCGEGISSSEDPELRVNTTEIELSNMGPDDRSRVQTSIEIENTGPGILRIDSIEWVEQPSRVDVYFDGPNSDNDVGCTTDAECTGDAICLTQSGNCRDRGFGNFPQEVRTDASFTQSLVISPSENPVICPEPPNSDVPNNYCGELKIKTNAPNDTENGEAGEATVYLVSDGSSGLMEMSESYLEYVLAAPETTQSLQFAITNVAESPLVLNSYNISQNAHWFTVTPSFAGTVIEGNQSETFTLEVRPPEGVTAEELNFQTPLTFDTSSVSGEPSATIAVTDGPGDVPLSEVDPLQLSFNDELTRTVQVKNYGSATLQLHLMEIRPAEVRDYYSVTYDGADVLADSGAIPNVGRMIDDEPAIEEFEVTFTPPADEEVSTVGTLRINHNDSFENNRTEVTLLGSDTDVAVGEVNPNSTALRSNGGEQIRHFAISNEGNHDLEITGVDLDTGSNINTDIDDYEFPELEAGMTVAPGGLKNARVIYTGANQFNQNLTVTPESNHLGQAQMMTFSITATDITDPTMDVEIVASFSESAVVEQTTSFTVSDESGLARLDQASWLTHERPEGSQAAIDGSGETVAFWPDVAGTYLISVTVDDADGREVQKTYEFEVVTQ